MWVASRRWINLGAGLAPRACGLGEPLSPPTRFTLVDSCAYAGDDRVSYVKQSIISCPGRGLAPVHFLGCVNLIELLRRLEQHAILTSLLEWRLCCAC